MTYWCIFLQYQTNVCSELRVGMKCFAVTCGIKEENSQPCGRSGETGPCSLPYQGCSLSENSEVTTL